MAEPEDYIIKIINHCVSKSRGGKLFKKFQKLTGKKGLAPEAFLLIGLLWGRPNRELSQIKEAYKKGISFTLNRSIFQNSTYDFFSPVYSDKLDKSIGDEWGEEIKMIITNMVSGGRDESKTIDDEKVREDVWELRESDSKAEVIQMFFNLRSFSHLRAIFDAYKELTGNEIEECIEGIEFEGFAKDAYLSMVKMLRDASEFYADRLKEAIEGAGTDDDTLISIVVLRAEIDLVDIIRAYEAKYATTLNDDVANDTSGDYKRILEKLLVIPEGMDVVEEEEPTVESGEMGVGTASEPLEDLLAAIEKSETEDTKEDD